MPQSCHIFIFNAMKKWAYYNEFDPRAAAWIRELIKQKLIPEGEVDERSITEVKPEDVQGFVQAHWFAGICGWPFALQLAGWDATRPIWTGSCPCQPFSAAGKRKGTADERHLWPEMFRLIRECRPDTIFGEQVASPDAMQWFDGVSVDMEGAGYAVGAADLCAAGVGAPHIRQRLYWVADSTDVRWAQHERESRERSRRAKGPHNSAERCGAGRLADSEHEQRQRSLPGRRVEHCENTERQADKFAGRCQVGGLANMPGSGSQGSELESERQQRQAAQRGGDSGGVVQSNGAGCEQGLVTAEAARYGRAVESASGLNAWSNYDIIQCLDGKARRTQSGIFPLAHGVPGRVGLLRGYGNAIVPQVAAEFVRAFMEI